MIDRLRAKPKPWSGQSAVGIAELGKFLLLGLVVSIIAYLTFTRMGVAGLVFLSAAALGSGVLLFFAFRAPVFIFILWLIAMSGLHSLGMLRMPGLPDFSFPRLFMVVILIMMPAGLILGKSFLKRPYLPDVLVVLHTAYVLANQQTIGDPNNFNLWYLSNLSPMLAYFFAKQFVAKEKHLRLIVWSFIAISAYFWYISIAEHFGLDALIWPKKILTNRSRWIGRSRGPFLQPALFGQLIGMYLLAHFYLLSIKVNPKLKLIVAGNLALGALGLLYTFTRGGWIATIVGVAVLVILRPAYRKFLLGLVAVGLLFGAIGLFQASNDELLKDRVENTGTIENRFGVMASAIGAIKANPVFGVGFFKYKEEAYKYSTGVYVPFYGYVTKKQGSHGSLHDIYIGRTAEEGLVGMALWFGFVIAVIRVFIRRWRENPLGTWYNRDFLALCAALFVTYLMGGLFFDYRFFDLVNVLPFFVAGIVVGFPGVKSPARTVENLPVGD